MMKTLRKIQYIGLVLCGAATLHGCSDAEHIIPQGTPVAFSTPDNWDNHTRLTTQATTQEGKTTYTTSFDSGDQIGIFADYLPGGAAGQQMDFMKNQEVTYTSGQWTYSPLKYWPTMEADKIRFYAYYPYSAASDNPQAIPFSGVETDLLYANTTTGKQESVPLEFKHALATIRLNVRCIENMTVEMTSAALATTASNPFKIGGTMDIQKGTISTTTSTEATTINFPFPNISAGITLNHETPQSATIHIPQHEGIGANDLSLNFTFDYGSGTDDPISYTLPQPTDNTYKQGHLYVYNLLLDEEGLTIESIIIAEYEKEPLQDVVVGRKDVFVGNTYYVSTAEYLRKIVDEINQDGNRDRNVTLLNDIDMAGINWKPIGDKNGYEGTFEGDGHTLSNLNVTEKVETTDLYYNWKETTDPVNNNENAKYECAGLIGFLNEGTVQNVMLNNVTIEHNSKYQNSDLHVAPVVAVCAGVIKNCHVSGTTKLSATALDNAYGAYDGRIGGITSMLYSNKNTADATCSTPISDDAAVIGCSVSGNFTAGIQKNQFSIMGGIVGYVYGHGGKVIACYVDGEVHLSITGKSDNTANAATIGGVVGLSEVMATGTPTTTLIGCYLNTTANSTAEIIGDAPMYNTKNEGARIGGLSAIFRMDRASNTQIIEDVIEACYWTDTNAFNTAYILPTAAQETAYNRTFDGKNQMFKISETNWNDAANVMNAAIDTYNSNANSTPRCDWKYAPMGEASPTLVPNK